MKELLEQAAKFLNEHPEFNEVEITDAFGSRVHLVRVSLAPNYWPQVNGWQPPQGYVGYVKTGRVI